MIAYAVQATMSNMDIAYTFHAMQAEAVKTARQVVRAGARAVLVHKLVVNNREDLVDVLSACCGHVGFHLKTEVVFQLEGLRSDPPEFDSPTAGDLFR